MHRLDMESCQKRKYLDDNKTIKNKRRKGSKC